MPQDYVIPVDKASSDPVTCALMIIRHFGLWGNSIFFISSAWFLLESDSFKIRKWIKLLIEVWSISLIFLIIVSIFSPEVLTLRNTIYSLFPSLFQTNWYISCYLLFYPAHPVLNKVIRGMNQTELFRTTLCLVSMYIFGDFIYGTWFFPSSLLLWMTIYFAVGYMKLYMPAFSNDVKKNIILFIICAVLLIALLLTTEYLGLHISYFSTRAMRWCSSCNPFLIGMSIALFNIARNMRFRSRTVNYVSSLSLLIYVIHENYFLRSYLRPGIWIYIYNSGGYNHVPGWLFIVSAVVFIASILLSAVYSAVFGRLIRKVVDRIYSIAGKVYLKIEKTAVNLLK